jgi:hypothetical protein
MLLTFSEKGIVVLIKCDLIAVGGIGLSTNNFTWWNSLPSFISNYFNHNMLGLPLYKFC